MAFGLLFTSGLPAFAQSVTVTGTVTDGTIGEPFVGVTVQVLGTSSGTVTDINGRFTIAAEKGKTLRFSFIGYKSIDYPLTGNTTDIAVTMQEDVQALDEVVVLGYGASAKKQDLSASVGIISNADKLTQRPVTSATSMLQGQIPGVTIANNGGDPTSMPNIVIRGQGSQNGDNVLWVVDGIPGAPITSVNDIESIVVLKDAASAAIYGAQSGAGGVILVTTKQAAKGKTSLTYDGTVGFQNATNLPKPLNAEQQLEMRRLSYKNAGQNIPNAWNPAINPWISTTRTNWMDEIFRTGIYHRHNVALNFGSDRSASRLSFSYNDNNGVLVGSYKKDLSIRYNGTFDLNDYIKIKEDLVWTKTSWRGANTSSGESGAVLSAIYMPASAEVYNPLTGGFGGTTTEDPEYIAKYGSNYADAHGDAINPMRLLTAENVNNNMSDLWTTTSLEIGNFIPGLKFASRFTYNLTNGYLKSFRPSRPEIGKPDMNNQLNESAFMTNAWKTENTLTYDNSFDRHNVGLLLSTTADHWKERGFSARGKDFADEVEELQYFSQAGESTADDYLSGPDANVSVIARAAYSYDDRYFLTASWRRDYAGRLPKGKKYGDFPAFTGAWKISNESFFNKTDAFSLLKLRASWGRIGNLGSIPMNYSYPLLSASNWHEGPLYGAEVPVYMDNFPYLSRVINPDLTWETSEQFDLGLDLAFASERLAISIDYFDKRTFNLIQEQSMDFNTTVGLDPMLVNLGEVRNRGVEVTAGWSDRIGKDFSYYVNANFSYLKNWVSNIGVETPDGSKGVWVNGATFRNLPYMMQTAEGEPIGSYYLIETDGIFQTDQEAQSYTNKDGEMIQPNAKAGDLKFVDFDGDGEISDGDRQYMGNAMPDYTYALTTGFNYKNFGFSMMLQGVQGAQALFVGKTMTLSDVNGNFNRDSRILDAWSPTNTSSEIPILSKTDQNANFSTPSDFYLEDASYLRIKNVTLSYDFTDLIRKSNYLADRSSTLSLFVSGENLFTFTKYSGMDPEVGGWDAMKYPVSRTISMGVKLTY
ncbi:MAG: TonB-dependent receptor [Porphyromonas sp.]|nr:TonB-dependent receptor [Porphyromonas sp.]